MWRPEIGTGLELTWETSRVVTLDTRWLTSTEQRDGRRPGDQLGFNIGYRERHGVVSLSVDWATELYWPDERRGGRQRVDVDEFSFQMDVRPGITVHVGDRRRHPGNGDFSGGAERERCGTRNRRSSRAPRLILSSARISNDKIPNDE